jgi:hypothetical protein
MSHITEAKQLMREFPKETRGYTWHEVMLMWEEYSDSMSAGWITPDEESVYYVFM